MHIWCKTNPNQTILVSLVMLRLILTKWQRDSFIGISIYRKYMVGFEGLCTFKIMEPILGGVQKSSAYKCSNEKGSSWIGSSKEAAFIIKCRNNVLNFQKISNQTKQAISMWKINLNIDFAGIKNLLRQNLLSRILLWPELFKSEMEQFFEGYLFSS